MLGEVGINRKELINLIGFYVAVGIHCYSRNTPFFFFGELLEVNQVHILLKLHKNAGYKSIEISEIVDIHKDRKYANENKRKMR